MAAQLGDTDDPTELVPGDVAGTGDKANTFRRIADGLGAVQRFDSEHAWTGPAADAYRKTVRDEQQRWDVAAAAFDEVATALTDHGNALRSAQDKAARAVELHRRGEQESSRAEKSHAAKVESAGPADDVAPFQDPGAAKRAEAQAILEQARAEFRSASSATAAALQRAGESAPEPSVMERLGDALRATTGTWVEGYKSFTGGALGALGEMGMGLLGVAAKPLHLMTDPAATISAGFATGAGVVHMVTTKEGWGQTVGSLDEWKKDPAAALGKATANIGTTIAGGGAGAGAKAASLGGKAAKAGKLGKLAPETPSGSPFDNPAPRPSSGSPFDNYTPDPGHRGNGSDLPYGYDEHGPTTDHRTPDPEPAEHASPEEARQPRGRPDWTENFELDPMDRDSWDASDAIYNDAPEAPRAPRFDPGEELQRASSEMEDAKIKLAELERISSPQLPAHVEAMSRIATRINDLEMMARRSGA